MAVQVSLASEKIFHVGTIPGLPPILGDIWITNSVLAGIIASLFLILFAIIVRPKFGLIPSKIQLMLEMIVGNFYDALVVAHGSESRAKKYLPYVMTLFLFFFVCNQFSLIPLINDIVANGTDPIKLFRTPTSDWSLPLTMALVTVVGAQVIAFAIHPIRHIGNYIKVKQFFTARSPMDFLFAFIEFCLGFLDIVSEFAKIISLSVRLFGNIFAGEVMVLIVASLVAGVTNYVFPMPIIVLSAFSGLVQAFVFAFLSLQFMSIVIQGARGEEPATA